MELKKSPSCRIYILTLETRPDTQILQTTEKDVLYLNPIALSTSLITKSIFYNYSLHKLA